MNTYYVLFCLENNQYLCMDTPTTYTRDFLNAKHFSSKENAIGFLIANGDNIFQETGLRYFTTREYFDTIST